MSRSAKLKKRLVYPGDELAVIEEFLGGPGSYQQDGVVRSSELGKSQYDLAEREIEVSKITREPILPREGLDVYCEVGAVQRRMTNCDVFMIDGKELSTTYTGVIHISSADGGSVRNMGLDIRSGDIVKAKIINMKNRTVQLSIDGPEYGVVYAYCSRCGTIMENRRGQLVCPRCGRTERRKISRIYGTEELL